ncbi:unnamed protein product [Leptosia nina]|uniref:Uncharacterized protein n=1 Tax=Leptosia nina TaxID=320188 RepID=A0AAV1JXV5_9NEOP
MQTFNKTSISSHVNTLASQIHARNPPTRTSSSSPFAGQLMNEKAPIKKERVKLRSSSQASVKSSENSLEAKPATPPPPPPRTRRSSSVQSSGSSTTAAPLTPCIPPQNGTAAPPASAGPLRLTATVTEEATPRRVKKRNKTTTPQQPQVSAEATGRTRREENPSSTKA